MPDTRPSAPQARSNGGIIFIVGGLVVAVGVLAYVLTGGSVGGSSTGSGAEPSSISIENNATAPAADPAPAAQPAPAAEPAPAAPAPAAPAPSTTP